MPLPTESTTVPLVVIQLVISELAPFGPPRPPEPTMTYRNWPLVTYACSWASVGAGSPPLKPPIAITGRPLLSSIEPASLAPLTATIQVALPRLATR